MELATLAKPEISASFMVPSAQKKKGQNQNKAKTDEALRKALLWLNQNYHGKVPNCVYTIFQNLETKLKQEREEYDRKFRQELLKRCESVLAETLPEIEKKIRMDVLEDRDEWNNTTNSIAFMLAMFEIYDEIEAEEVFELMEKSNEIIGRVNSGEKTMVELAEDLGKYGMKMDKKAMKVLSAYEKILEKGELEIVKVEQDGEYCHFPHIKQYISEHNMDLDTFAECAGISVKTLENLLNNPKADPKLSTIQKILNCTGMGYRWAFEEMK